MFRLGAFAVNFDEEGSVLLCRRGDVDAMTYMVVLPCVRPELRGRPIEGMIQYPDEAVFISATEIDAAFRKELRTLIHAVGGSTPPARVPSTSECMFCPGGSQDCPDRIEDLERVAVIDHDLF